MLFLIGLLFYLFYATHTIGTLPRDWVSLVKVVTPCQGQRGEVNRYFHFPVFFFDTVVAFIFFLICLVSFYRAGM